MSFKEKNENVIDKNGIFNCTTRAEISERTAS
jgi:hypothetical protein